MSGHSKWSTIKHKKGTQDAKRGRLFTKLSREIMVATRSGDPNPEMNFRLRLAVDNAKSNNMPKDNIDRAIAKGSGITGSGPSLEEITYEGYGPGGAGIIIQTLTDNKNRSATEIRTTMSRNGGSLAQAGSVAWNFEQKGEISVTVEKGDPEEAALEIVDVGAEDVDIENSTIGVITAYDDFSKVQNAIKNIAGLIVERAELAMVPSSSIGLDHQAAQQTLRLLDLLEELDDVQKVFSNADFSEDVLEEYSNR